MAALEDIKSGLDVHQIAGLLGTDPETADAAVDSALGSLLHTMGTNVEYESDALSLANALGQHTESPAFGETIDLDGIDTDDGAKIVGHVYSPDQVQQLATSRQGGMIEKLLPLLAPIVMAYLAKRFNGYLNEQMGGAQAPTQAPEHRGGGLGDLLGSILGGGSSSQSGGGGLGDLLGSILGGGSSPQAQAPEPAQAPASFPPAPATQRSDGLRMDAGDSSSAAAPNQGNVLGGILKDILLGGR